MEHCHIAMGIRVLLFEAPRRTNVEPEAPANQGIVSSHAEAATTRFDSLYANLRPSLWRYVYRMVGDGDAADDIVQEAFVRLLRRSDLDGEDARLWIFTVATNLVRDRGRTATRRRRLLETTPYEPPRPRQAHEGVERAEKIAAVRDALEQLPLRDRQLLLMREEGFRYHEMAEVVGVAAGSVGTLIARAVRRFTEIYVPRD